MPNITPVHLIIILVIAVLVLGPGKLPEVGAALGKSIREFRKAATDVQESISTSASQPAAPQPPAPVAPAPAPGVPVAPAEPPAAPGTEARP